MNEGELPTIIFVDDYEDDEPITPSKLSRIKAAKEKWYDFDFQLTNYPLMSDPIDVTATEIPKELTHHDHIA